MQMSYAKFNPPSSAGFLFNMLLICSTTETA
jgi:hypothetical protein